jgi:dihydroceramidase
VTSSIDWCERNYVVSFFVGEWWSTLSNSLAIVLALWGMCMALGHGCELRFVATYANIALVGVGSVAFHGTLTHIGQQGDETPMIFSAACWMVVIWFMDPTYEARHPGLFRRCAWVAVVLCCVFACTHYVYRFTTSFQIFFAAMPSRRSTAEAAAAGAALLRGHCSVCHAALPGGSSPGGGGPPQAESG